MIDEPGGAASEGRDRGLRSRIFSATLWTLFLRLVVRSFTVASTLVVARWIPQAEIGTYGIIIILDSGLVALTTVGLSAFIVQTQKDPAPYYDTAWTADVLRAVFVFLLEVIIAPYWCALFKVPEATNALRILALGQLALGFHSISSRVLTRALKFNRIFFTYMSESVTYAIVAIVGAMLFRNMWALVTAYVAAFFVRVLVSYAVSPVRARFGLDLAKMREMFAYSKWLFGYGVLNFILETLDNAVTGRVLGNKALAQYRMSYQLSAEGSATIQYVVTSVALPTFAAIQIKPESVRQNFRALLGMVLLTMIPATASIALCSDQIVQLVVGVAWAQAAAPLRILAFTALFRSVLNVAQPVLRALDHTRGDFIVKVVQAVVLLGLLYPAAVRYGMVGVAVAATLSSLAALPAWVATLRAAGRFSASDFIIPAIAPIASGLVAASVLLLLPAGSITWASLLVRGLSFVGAYVLMTAVFYRLVPASGLGAVVHGTGR